VYRKKEKELVRQISESLDRNFIHNARYLKTQVMSGLPQMVHAEKTSFRNLNSLARFQSFDFPDPRFRPPQHVHTSLFIPEVPNALKLP
jgi:hypothetical protein